MSMLTNVSQPMALGVESPLCNAAASSPILHPHTSGASIRTDPLHFVASFSFSFLFSPSFFP